MAHFLTTHREPGLPKQDMRTRWIALADERRAVWVKTWYNVESGRRFCWWDAPNKEALEAVFRDHGVSWEQIVQVQLTTPSEWRWRED